MSPWQYILKLPAQLLWLPKMMFPCSRETFITIGTIIWLEAKDRAITSGKPAPPPNQKKRKKKVLKKRRGRVQERNKMKTKTGHRGSGVKEIL